MAYWHGEDIIKEDHDSYKERITRGAEKVMGYISPTDIEPCLSRAVETCNPRRRLSPLCNAKSEEASEKAKGASRALSSMIVAFRAILNCANFPPNYVIDRLPDNNGRLVGDSGTTWRGGLYIDE